jgi:hypothetical protein
MMDHNTLGEIFQEIIAKHKIIVPFGYYAIVYNTFCKIEIAW